MRTVRTNTGGYRIWCEGCQENHVIAVDNPQPNAAVWTFNGDLNLPTFQPSVFIKWGIYADPNWQEPDDRPGWSGICHSFITNGNIQYLSDCTHSLAGKTIPLKEIE